MRFIAVYNQGCQSQGRSFNSPVDAIDYLFWGYEDHEFVPQGIYDSLTDQITVYTHSGKFLATINPESIRMTAQVILGARQSAS